MNAHDTRQLATQLLDALVRDVRTISAAVAGLAQLEGKGNWSNADETALRQHQAKVAELVSRYRTGESILTVKPAPPAGARALIEEAARVSCECDDVPGACYPCRCRALLAAGEL